jgi:hypothetical protein
MGLFQGLQRFKLKKQENKQPKHAGKFVWRLIGSWDIFIWNFMHGGNFHHAFRPS